MLYEVQVVKPKDSVRARKNEVLHFRVAAASDHEALDKVRASDWGIHMTDAVEVSVSACKSDVAFVRSNMR